MEPTVNITISAADAEAILRHVDGILDVSVIRRLSGAIDDADNPNGPPYADTHHHHPGPDCYDLDCRNPVHDHYASHDHAQCIAFAKELNWANRASG
jgi:hypothetical protein